MKELYQKYGPLAIIILFTFLSYLLLKPFILPIITAALIAYIFYPLHNFVAKKTNETFSAVLMVILVFLIIIIPSIFITTSLISEIPGVYNTISEQAQEASILNNFLDEIKVDLGLEINIASIFGTLASKMLVFLQNFLVVLPGKILNVVMTGFFLFYLFKEGKIMLKKLIHWLPFGVKNTKKVFKEVKIVTDAVVYGQVVTAVVQAIIATIAYLILGIKAPFFWGILTLFFAMIPMFGAPFGYIPVAILQIVGYFTGEGSLLKGIFILAYGLGIVSSVDNIIKPILVSDKVKIHPAAIIVGMIGGLSVFGIVGVVLGPLIITTMSTLFKIYELKHEIYG